MILADQQDYIVCLIRIKDNTLLLKRYPIVCIIPRTIPKYHKKFIALKCFWIWQHQNLSSICMDKGWQLARKVDEEDSA